MRCSQPRPDLSAESDRNHFLEDLLCHLQPGREVIETMLLATTICYNTR
ncbi:MAG: hypothetical protein P8Z30_19485 [Acidobacteriota bacterium]